MRANSKLTPPQFWPYALGLNLPAYAEQRFNAMRPEVEAGHSARNPVRPEDYKAKSVLFLTDKSRLPELERPWLASRIELMETTNMAVVVSQSQNELKLLDEQSLDIRPHRERMNREDLAEKFKDAGDPLRIVFVCAMWMTGFDAPSVSTVYLDRPMRNHTLMQTIARANRVFPDKDNGLIVDYAGVFRNMEQALVIHGAGSASRESSTLPSPTSSRSVRASVLT